MLNDATRRRRDRDEGFSLVEMTIVLMILGVLVSTALIAFTGVRGRAEQRVAQVHAYLAYDVAVILASDGQLATRDGRLANDTTVFVDWYEAEETSLDFVDGSTASTSSHEVSVQSANTNDLGDPAIPLHRIAVLSDDGNCYFLIENRDGLLQHRVIEGVVAGGCKANAYDSVEAEVVESGW